MSKSNNTKKSGSLVAIDTASKGSTAVSEKTGRRIFTNKYKREIVKKIEAAKGERGAVGKLLRAEGLYSSQVAKWKTDAKEGLLSGANRKRGPKPDPEAKTRRESEKLQKQIARLEKKLKQAEAVIDIQKKISLALGVDSEAGHESA